MRIYNFRCFFLNIGTIIQQQLFFRSVPGIIAQSTDQTCEVGAIFEGNIEENVVIVFIET